MVITQSDLFDNIRFYKYVHNSRPMGSPDMILNAFYVKFHEKQDEIPPRACRPSKSKEKRQFAGYGLNKLKKNNVDQVGSPARAGGPGGAAPLEEEKGGIYTYIAE